MAGKNVPPADEQEETSEEESRYSEDEQEETSEEESRYSEDGEEEEEEDEESKETTPTPKRKSQVQGDAGKDSRSRKRVKVSAVPASGAFVRVWSEEDELAVLEGMIDYQKSKGVSPSNDMNAFHEFIKGKLNGDMSRTQVNGKVRRLKKKFLSNAGKALRSGEDPILSNAHESKAFELSKMIWGDGGISGGGTAGIPKKSEKKGVAKVDRIVEGRENDDVGVDDVKGDDENFASKYPHLSQSLDLDDLIFLPKDLRSCLKQNFSLIKSVKAKELEEKWKKWCEVQAEFLIEGMSLMAVQTELVLNAMKGGN